MQKKYVLLTMLIFFMFFIVAIVAERNNCDSSISSTLGFKSPNCSRFTPEKLLIEALRTDRYISLDELAEKVISEDPTYILVDIRDKKQFESYCLPGSINIPFEKLLDNEYSDFKSEAYIKVIYSNSTLLSDRAWILLRRKGCKSIKVLDGGLNEFFTTLMDPPKPLETDPEKEFEKYRFRKAAAVYFGMPNPYEFIPEYKQAAGNKYQKNIPFSASSKVKRKVKPAPKQIVEPELEEEEDEGC
jgi:rhodanese-related sulfurtransferase